MKTGYIICLSLFAFLSSATHFEHQPHKWAAAWTVERISGRNGGGNFFISDYGIQVMSAPNTLVVWQPRHLHGTSLQNYRPDEINPFYAQRGMAFVTSTRLMGVWKKYWANIQAGMEQEAAKEAAYQEMYVEDCNDEPDDIFESA